MLVGANASLSNTHDVKNRNMIVINFRDESGCMERMPGTKRANWGDWSRLQNFLRPFFKKAN